MITQRDKNIICFLEKFKIARLSTIQELFFPSLRTAQMRMKKLYEQKVVKRERDTFTSEYVYYIRKPKQFRHRLLLTDFYREINKIAGVEYFENEVTIGDIRPDGLIAYRYKNKGYIAFVEVQISNTPLDIKKYEKLYRSKQYKKYFPVFPIIYAVTDRKIPDTELKIMQIDEDVSNLKKDIIIMIS